MKWQVSIVVAAILVAPLIGLAGYVLYDSRRQAAVRDYHESVAAYRAYLDTERRRRETDDQQFETIASSAIREAESSRGSVGAEAERSKFESLRRQRQLQHRIDDAEKALKGPPPPEWMRFQQAAERAAMPKTID